MQKISFWSNKLHLSQRDLPIAPDGLYDWQAREDVDDSTEGSSFVTNVIKVVGTVIKKNRTAPRPRHVAGFLDLALHPTRQNDRLGAFQSGLDIMSRLPPNSHIGTEMSDAAVGLFYNSLAHPPTAYLGHQAAFRQADGGFNNMNEPDLGRSGMAYARNVQSKKAMPLSALPDPGLVFDTLLKARDRVDHCGGHSGLIFAFASLVSHSLFRTKPSDWTINDTSSYLDLSPLYGHNQQTQDLVRDKESGRGLLWNDTFAEERLLFQPPAVNAMLVLFSRNHNYIAEMLLKVNERKAWRDPPPEDPMARAQQDEEIFQTARLINCGHFREIIMGDYVSSFFGLSEGNPWSMNAFDPIKLKNGQIVPRGEGNHVSVEFNLLYRWHSTISQHDEEWTKALFHKIFYGKPFHEINMDDLEKFFRTAMRDIEPDPKQRTFAGLVRDPNGRFPDDQIARIIQDSTESPGGQFRARGTPEVLRIIEILGIHQGRKWNVCTMNEFRKFLNLKEFESFEEWNPDPDIASTARQLYKHIDNLELYTGLQCESTMPLSCGLKFSCGYTITQAVLAEAICLIRGDRFLSTDFTPALLTAWGYRDCKRDPHNGGFGGALPKLLFRHFGRYYPYNNVYGLFPFFSPMKMKESLTEQRIENQYTFERPVATPLPKVLRSLTDIKYISDNPSSFISVCHSKHQDAYCSHFLPFDDKATRDNEEKILNVILPSEDWQLWYGDMTTKSIKSMSWQYDGVPGMYVDIVQAINHVVVYWAAEKLCGISLKTKSNPRGLYTVHEVYEMFTTLFSASFLSMGDNEHLFSLRRKALKASRTLKDIVITSLAENLLSKSKRALVGLWMKLANSTKSPAENVDFSSIRQIASAGYPVEQLVSDIIRFAVCSSVTQTQAAINAVNFYLNDGHAAELAEIQQLIRNKDVDVYERLRGYVREAMRLNPQCPDLWRECIVDIEITQSGSGTPIKVQRGDLVLASLKDLYHSAAKFPNPDVVDSKRPKTAYNLCDFSFHSCPGNEFAVGTITEIVRVIFGQKNVRRAAGDAGQLVGVKKLVNEAERDVYVQIDGNLTPWPPSMHIIYDDGC